MNIASAIAHPNIAFIKYWGKANILCNIPATSSLSITLGNLKTHTTIKFSSQEKFYLNNQELLGPAQVRLRNFLEFFRQEFSIKQNLSIYSHNLVPYACGLASSASGFAALTKALDHIFNLNLSTQELSILARRGSASAARSIFSDYAILFGDTNLSSNQAYAEPIKTNPNLNLSIFVILINTREKKLGSTQAMIHTQESSLLFQKFLNNNKKYFIQAKKALAENNFLALGEATENSTKYMHKALQNSQPPICYSEPLSLKIIKFVQELRARENQPIFYTQDAGPNIKIITPTANKIYFTQILQQKFPDLNFKICQSGPGAHITNQHILCPN